MTARALLNRLQALYRQHAQIEHQIAEVERAIVATGKGPPKRRRRKPISVTAEIVRETVKVLQEAGPLPRREIAVRLGLTSAMAGYRLQQAVEAGFVERIGSGRYQAAKVIPAL